MNEETIDQKMSQASDVNFSKWLRQPEVKLLMTLIPACELPELLASLMRSAFEAGVSSGTGVLMGDIMRALITRGKQKD